MNSLSLSLWLLVYNIVFNPLLISIAVVLFSPVRKVRETLLHHRGIWKRLKSIKEMSGNKPLVWFHVSSAGEYLMAKPVLDIIVKNNCHVFVSVTSISGYKWLKRESPKGISFDFMPLDFFYNSKKAINLMKPTGLVFIRNDIWPNLKNNAVRNNIPVFFLGAPKRNPKSVIKKSFYKFIYSGFQIIFTITKEAFEFHKELNSAPEVIFSGDTKYDIVISRQNERKIKISNPGSPCVALGSVWSEDLKITLPSIKNFLREKKAGSVIIAPHEITLSSTRNLLSELAEFSPILYSSTKSKPGKFRVLIVDTIGDLFFLYENSSIAYVGGGFGEGIHNILEPASMGNAVIFGPKHGKFPEAGLLVNSGSGFCVKSEEDFKDIFNKLSNDLSGLKKLAAKSRSMVLEKAGASGTVARVLIKTLKLK